MPKSRTSPRAIAQTLRYYSRLPVAEWLTLSRAYLAKAWDEEHTHRTGFLWLPVAFGLGILAYFAARQEPSLWAGPGLAALALIWSVKARGLLQGIVLALLFMALGFSAGTFRAALQHAPMLERQGIYEITGFIEQIDITANRHRLLMRPTVIEGVKPEALPFRIRVGAPGQGVMEPGAHIKLRARLGPPSEAAMPGGYDFRRDSFFRAIGAVGYALGTPQTEKSESMAPLGLRLNASIDHWRNMLTDRIARAIGGEAGALSAALITGKRGLISENTNDDLRASGLYHIVSISGLHMVLAAGVLFWLIRAMLAAMPGIALRYPIKKIAAIGGMAGATFYCIFSGSEVATERSLIMILVMLGAVVFDRPALAMRNLALSALIVLAREPESLLGPSFQMSFAAVAGLISANQVWRDWRATHAPAKEHALVARWARTLIIAFLGIIATTLVASIATAPFSAWHFHRLNPYGVIGNALAIPLVSLVVMPAAVAGTLLVPFGLDWIIWLAMGEGVGGVLFVAERVAQIENAAFPVARASNLSFAILIAGMLFFACLRSKLRWFSLILLGLWAMSVRQSPLPDLLVDPTGKTALVMGESGRYRLLSVGSASTFTLAQWLPSLGDVRGPRDASLKEGVRCDTAGCTTRLRDGRIIALSLKRDSLRQDCQTADIIITPQSGISACDRAKRVLDRTHFERYGATRIVTHNATDWQMEATLSPDSQRPWRKPSKAMPSSKLEPSSQGAPIPNGEDPALTPQ